MKRKEAMEMINPENKEAGFMVSFEVRERSILRSDHFPDKHAGEELIETEEEAWELARKFANATDDKYVNIYVTDHTFSPVRGYDSKTIRRYSPGSNS